MQASSSRSDPDPGRAGTAGAATTARGVLERPARSWRDAAELCRVEVAEALARSIAAGRFDRVRYQNWLAMESVACRIGALSLDAVACWHGSQPALQAAARRWASDLREDAQVAARDVRVLDGMSDAAPDALRQWHAFAGAAGCAQRTGEVLGAVVLHACLFGGPMRTAVAAVATLPFSSGGQYLARRLQSGYASEPDSTALLDAYAAASLTVGAQRAAGWYRAALAEVLGPKPA